MSDQSAQFVPVGGMLLHSPPGEMMNGVRLAAQRSLSALLLCCGLLVGCAEKKKTAVQVVTPECAKVTLVKKKAKLRRIDQGTRYDITGRLRGLVREIERGELGDVRDVVIGVRIQKFGGNTFELYHLGTGNIAEVLHTLEGAKQKML